MIRAPFGRWLRSGAALALAVVPIAQAAHGEELTKLERERAYVMLRDVRQTIEQHYFDPKFKGIDLAAQAEVARTRITKAGSIGEALAAIAQFELELDDSHTVFAPPRLTVDVDYGWDMKLVGGDCCVVRVKPGSDAARQGVAAGDRVITVNGFKPDRGNLWRVHYLLNLLRPQPGLHVELVTPAGTARELDLAAAMHRRKEVMDLTAGGSDIGRYFQKQEQDESERAPASAVVGSDVYILRLPSFNVRDGSIPWLVRGARGRAVMIIDLRGNRGGAVSVLNELLGQVSSTDIPIGSLRERDSSVAQVAKGAGRDAYDGRLFVLVDSESASASEVFARAIQLANRGTVIGDRTAGAVMISRFWTLEVGSGDNVIFYGTNVTVGDPVMSDGGRLEKTGVEPDFLVLPSAEDLANGRDPALAQALKFAGHPMDADAAGKILPRPPKSL